MIIGSKGDGVTTRFSIPAHGGLVKAFVNGSAVSIASQGFDFVVLSAAPAAGSDVTFKIDTLAGAEVRLRSSINLQADGAQSYSLPGSRRVAVYVAPEASATGTVAITYKPRGGSSDISLVDSTDTQVTFNLASPGQPYVFDGDVESVTFTPTGVTFGYRALVTAWQ